MNQLAEKTPSPRSPSEYNVAEVANRKVRGVVKINKERLQSPATAK